MPRSASGPARIHQEMPPEPVPEKKRTRTSTRIIIQTSIHPSDRRIATDERHHARWHGVFYLPSSVLLLDCPSGYPKQASMVAAHNQPSEATAISASYPCGLLVPVLAFHLGHSKQFFVLLRGHEGIFSATSQRLELYSSHLFRPLPRTHNGSNGSSDHRAKILYQCLQSRFYCSQLLPTTHLLSVRPVEVVGEHESL
jgi:hypothetical protein